MERPSVAWAIIWRMTLYDILVGGLCGWICGPAIIMTLFSIGAANGKYNVFGFIGDLLHAAAIAGCAGVLFGLVFGFVGGALSGVILTLGILRTRERRLAPGFYRNVIIGLCVIGPLALVLLAIGMAAPDLNRFLNSNNIGPFLLFLVILPAMVCSISLRWATMSVVQWWETSGYDRYSSESRDT